MEVIKGFSTMPKAIEEMKNYYSWIHRILKAHIGRSVLEVGPGFGNLAKLIIQDGYSYCGVDLDPEVIAHLQNKFKGVASAEFLQGDVENLNFIARLQEKRIDTIVSMNVLEHLENPENHLACLARAAPGGKIFILVPAMPSLYGQWDREVGHYRRFRKTELQKLLQDCRFQPIHLQYFNTLACVGWFLLGRIFKRGARSPLTNQAVRFYDRWVIPLAESIDALLNPFFGLSVIAVAQNPKDGVN